MSRSFCLSIFYLEVEQDEGDKVFGWQELVDFAPVQTYFLLPDE